MVSNQRGILGGLDFAKETFRLVDKKINIKVEDNAMSKPLAAEANVIAKTTSDDDKGLWTTSVIVPIILPIINDELECAKLC